MFNLKALGISLLIFGSLAIYIMYLKASNEVLQANLDIQKDLYNSTFKALQFQKSKSNFQKDNLNNIQNSIKAKENTKFENTKRGLVNEVSNANFTIVFL